MVTHQATHKVTKDGGRGRNRTYNLLIKSQLLCQLSYAPTANGKVGTNFDYSIGSTRFCARLFGRKSSERLPSFTMTVQLSGLRRVWVFWRRDFMRWNKTVLATLLAGVIISAALAQNATAQIPVRRPSTGTGPTTRAPRQEPCWEVAGVSRSALQQRRGIAQQARHEVEAVCANSSLSIQQRRQQMQQIHQRERQEIEGIISPAQQDAMRTCQEQRHGGGHGGGGHLGGGHGGPCGEMTVGHKAHPMEEDEMPANEAAKPN